MIQILIWPWQKVMQELVNFAHALRKASEETEITILMSYRAITNITN